MGDWMIIEHDPDELPRKKSWYWDRGIYLIAWGGLALLWIMQIKDGFNWEQIALGFGTGAIFIATAIEITGNKLPTSWRGKPPR